MSQIFHVLDGLQPRGSTCTDSAESHRLLCSSVVPDQIHVARVIRRHYADHLAPLQRSILPPAAS